MQLLLFIRNSNQELELSQIQENKNKEKRFFCNTRSHGSKHYSNKKTKIEKFNELGFVEMSKLIRKSPN